MIDNIRHKSVRKKTGSRIAAIQILYLHHFNDQPLDNSILTFNKYYKKFLLEKLEIKELDDNLLHILLKILIKKNVLMIQLYKNIYQMIGKLKD